MGTSFSWVSFPRLVAFIHVAIVVVRVVLPSFMQAWFSACYGFCRLKPSTVAITASINVTVATAAPDVEALSYRTLTVANDNANSRRVFDRKP